MRKGIASLALAAAVVAAAPAEARKDTQNYTSLTVFGDSLVDAGNIRADSNNTRLNPEQGYFQGRWTNGYDYTDLLNLQLFGTPTLASQLGGSNYAYGGARILDTSVTLPHLPDQFARFQALLGPGRADPNGLFVLNFGANDLFNLGTAADNFYGGNRDALLRDAAFRYAEAVTTLQGWGVRNILLTDFPVAGTPANTYLDDELAKLSLNADTTLLRFNYLDAFGRIRANPAAFGIAPFDKGTATCQSGGRNAIDGGCVGYFTLDGTHPVAAVQRALFDDMQRQFGLVSAEASVPEPATWGLTILGFALVGGAVRRPRVRVSYRPA